MGVRVRVAGVGDLAGVLRVERSSVEAPHWSEGEYLAALDGGTAVRRCLMVAEVEGLVAGFAVGKVAAGVGELESVAVAGEARRQGVGRALCLAVMEWCRAQGAGAMDLEVRAGSVGAIGLYEGLGFVAVGRRRGYYREPVEDALLMQRELRTDGFC
jgi:[ribosomal protein S18]-alanine N-acetyltransferase